MDEKKNNSNNPNEKQPQLEDGTYTFKGKTANADSALSAMLKSIVAPNLWKASLNNYDLLHYTAGLNEDEIKYIYHELDEKGLIENEDGSKFDFESYFKEDHSLKEKDDEINLDDLEQLGASESWDGDTSDLEEFGGSETFDDKPKVQLEGKKADVFNAAGEEYGLSDEKLKKASEEQIDELQKAIDEKIKAEASIDALKQEIEKTENELQIASKQLSGNGTNHPLSNVFKDKTIYEKDYEEYKYKLAAKKDYYQQILDNETEADSAKEFAKKKLKEIEDYEIAASNFEIGSTEELQKKVDELGKKFASLLEEKKTAEETIGKSDGVINAFVDEDAPYGKARKSKALSFGFNAPSSLGKGNTEKGYYESKKYLSSSAQEQWKSMTDEERAFLTYYTNSYSWVNEPLRGEYYSGSKMPKYVSDGKYVQSGAPNKKKAFEHGVGEMTKAIAKCKLNEDMWFQRWTGDLDIGITGSLINYINKNGVDSVVGLTFRHKNFASMGASKGHGYGSQKITMNLYCPKGVEAHYIAGSQGGIGSENEIILNRGYSMRISKCEEDDYGNVFLDVDVILGSNTKEALDQDLKDALNYV